MQESAAVAAFRQQLTKPWTRKQLPHNFTRAFANAQAAGSSDTRRIFLDAGFNAWLAYFLAKESTTQNYSGKTARLEAIASFEKLPEEEQKRVAIDLLKTPVHETVKAQITKLNRHAIARKSKEASSDSSRPMTLSSSEMQCSPTTTFQSLQQPQQSQQPPRSTGVNSTMTFPESTGGIWTRSQSARELANSLAVPFGPSEQETVSGPPASRLPTIFPQYSCSMIRKTGDRASVTMVFPYTVGVVCLMSLSILSHKLEHLAMKLFGVHIEVENGFRYVVLKEGVRLFPRPSLVIQGADDEAMGPFIGSTVTKAVNLSPARKEEINQAILATRCVTLEISSDPQEDGVLNLNLA